MEVHAALLSNKCFILILVATSAPSASHQDAASPGLTALGLTVAPANAHRQCLPEVLFRHGWATAVNAGLCVNCTHS